MTSSRDVPIWSRYRTPPERTALAPGINVRSTGAAAYVDRARHRAARSIARWAVNHAAPRQVARAPRNGHGADGGGLPALSCRWVASSPSTPSWPCRGVPTRVSRRHVDGDRMNTPVLHPSLNLDTAKASTLTHETAPRENESTW